ncbi:MAG TPA: DUF2188 domain-containing protein [Hyphomicrobiaceae bacterium]|nr:DUF2188 domain-containing protein [Hyphomicrobiaceae bacterium]
MRRGLHVAPGDHDDWIVREDGGRELGHYPTQQEAEAVGRKLAQKRKAQLLIHARSGEVERLSGRRHGWFARLIGR